MTLNCPAPPNTEQADTPRTAKLWSPPRVILGSLDEAEIQPVAGNDGVIGS